jgi:hypothetical protein
MSYKNLGIFSDYFEMTLTVGLDGSINTIRSRSYGNVIEGL